MQFINQDEEGNEYGLNNLQKVAMSIMTMLAIITFVGTNLQAIFWQSSDWLVSTVLPAVVVQLTNQERLDNAAAPLQRSATLDAAAKLKAEDMAKHEYFSHFSPDGVSPWHWFDEAGYTFAYAGENLAIHFTDSSEVVDAWMKSPTHRENIVNGSYTEIGVGTAKGKYEGYDTVYVVQLFGTPAVAPAPKKPSVPKPPVVETVPVVEDLALVTEETTSLPEVAGKSSLVTESTDVETIPVTVETSDTLETKTTVPEVIKKETELPQPIFVENEVDANESVVAQADTDFITAETNLSDVVVIESPIIATSSGLAVANFTVANDGHAGATVASIATQPNLLLQSIYMVLGVLVLLLLSVSIVMEARRFHYMQVAYGFMLLFGMGGLWFIHTLLTTGAVIV